MHTRLRIVNFYTNQFQRSIDPKQSHRMQFSVPILPFLIIDMHAYFSYCSTSCVSPVIQTHFTVKCTSNTTAQTETGAKSLLMEACVYIIVRPRVCFGALLVAKLLQNAFQWTQKSSYLKQCTPEWRGTTTVSMKRPWAPPWCLL